MLAASVATLPRASSCRGGCVYEPKWDGWRCLAFGDHHGRVYLQSRAGKPLALYFPEISRLVGTHLPRRVVVDGELVIWEPGGGRTSFVRLQRRVAAGARTLRLARETPAHYVLFDLLQDAGGEQLLHRPLAERRARLAELLDQAPPQLALCPQTDDVAEAADWHTNWSAAGVEGLIIKGPATLYRPGIRGWRKYRVRSATEAIVGGVTGSRRRPETVLVGRLDAAGRLRYLGRTNTLVEYQAAELAAHLTPPALRRGGGLNHPWPQPLPAGWSPQFRHLEPLPYLQVQPSVVVEVNVDTAYEHQRWRHGARYVRIRADLSIYDVPLAD